MDTLNGEFFKWFATLGVGGVLAGIIFYFYRKDMIRNVDQWKGQTDILVRVIEGCTVAITRNTSVVEALHRRTDASSELLEGLAAGHRSILEQNRKLRSEG